MLLQKLDITDDSRLVLPTEDIASYVFCVQVRAAFLTLFCLITTVAFTGQLQSFPAAVSPCAEGVLLGLLCLFALAKQYSAPLTVLAQSVDLVPWYVIYGLSCT